MPPTSSHPALAVATPLFANVGDVRESSPEPAPARRRMKGNGLGDDAEQALRAAARSGLKLILNDDDF